MNKNANERISKILTQVEYYLSNDNLSADQFFHTKISDSKEVVITLF